MKKTKVMMTGFAVFAALLMLMATCMARPTQEKASIETIEFAEKELMNSLEALNVKLTRDPDVARIVNRMETARSEEEIIAGAEQLRNVLQDSPEFEQLVTLIEGDCSTELEATAVDINGADGNIQTSNVLWTILKWIIEWIRVGIFILIYRILDWLFGDDDGGATT